MEKTMIDTVYQLIPGMLSLAKRPVWFDYDKEADVLYISFRRPQDATETTPMNDHVLLRRREGDIVGLTILNASRISQKKS